MTELKSAATPELMVLAGGFLIPEGPVCLPDGSLVIVEVGRGRISRIANGGAVSVVAETGGGPNGAALGPDGALYVCNNGGGYQCAQVEGRLSIRPDLSLYSGGSIQRVDLATGRVVTLFTHDFDGKPLIAPNDLVFSGDGGLWFTDHGRSWGGSAIPGAIYHARVDSARAPVKLMGDLRSPNGIGLSPDEATLYWADSLEASLWSAAIVSEGALAVAASGIAGERIASMPEGYMFDSLAVQADGAPCVATCGRGGVTRFTTSDVAEHFAFPDNIVTNICFGGGDLKDVYVTAAEAGVVMKLRWHVAGAPLAF